MGETSTQRERPGSTDAQWLRNVTFFATLSKETLDHVAGASSLRHYRPDEHILLEGDRCEAGYFILEGAVRVYRVSREGREQVLVQLGPGQAFNTVPVFEPDGQNPANVVALSEVTLCVLLKEDFLHLVRTHGDLAMVVLEDFAQRLSHLTNLVEGLALHSVQERLARFLLDSAPQQDGINEEVRDWTQQEIAVHLGTVRDVVGRELRALEDAGLIRRERGRIVLLSRVGLERKAGR